MIAFFKKKHKDIVKLNFLQCLDLIAMKILSPKIWINEILSKLFFINLGTQTGLPENWVLSFYYIVNYYCMYRLGTIHFNECFFLLLKFKKLKVY